MESENNLFILHNVKGQKIEPTTNNRSNMLVNKDFHAGGHNTTCVYRYKHGEHVRLHV